MITIPKQPLIAASNIVPRRWVLQSSDPAYVDYEKVKGPCDRERALDEVLFKQLKKNLHIQEATIGDIASLMYGVFPEEDKVKQPIYIAETLGKDYWDCVLESEEEEEQAVKEKWERRYISFEVDVFRDLYILDSASTLEIRNIASVHLATRSEVGQYAMAPWQKPFPVQTVYP